MRNLSNSQYFCVELEKILDEFITSSSSEVLSRIAPNVYDARFENSYRFTSKNLENFVCLSLLSYYLPEEVGTLLRLSIQEEIQETDLDWIELLLYNKGSALCFLIETTLWHCRDFFGNVVTKRNLRKALSSMVPRMKTRRKPKRVLRHRGYRDKGTLRKESDKHDLWISTTEQLKIEEERESQAQTLKFLFGWFT